MTTTRKIINQKADYAPPFEGELSLNEWHAVINEQLQSLQQNPTLNTVTQIKEKIEQYQIISYQNSQKEKPRWVIGPFYIHVVTFERSNKERIITLLKSFGRRWADKLVYHFNLEVDTREFPAVQEVTPISSEPTVNQLYAHLIALKTQAETLMKKGITKSAVFTKPDGVLNLNRMKSWLTEFGINEQDVQFVVEIQSMDSVLEKLTITLNEFNVKLDIVSPA